MKNFALITGASAGLGAEFARQLAARGWPLVLTARRGDRLEALAEDLRQQHGVQVHVLTGDLSKADTPLALQQQCSELGCTVDMLVNNAGYGVPGEFDSHPLATHEDMLQTMLTAVVQLTHLFYPGMKQRGYGRIIQVSSLAGFAPPTAGHTLYPAIKSFLIKFAQSLNLEAKDHGVHVSALCPGFTYTEFHDVNGTRVMMSKLPKGMWMQAEQVVCEGLDAVEKNQPVKINGFKNRLLAGVARLVPDRWMRSFLQRFRKR